MAQLKEVYEPCAEYKAFYTGGEIQWTTDGAHLLCQCEDVVHVIDVTSTATQLTLGAAAADAEPDHIYTFRLSHDNERVVTAHRSGLVKLWARGSGEQLQAWRGGHRGPVARLAFDAGDARVASGGADGAARVWDLAARSCCASLRGALGVFSVLRFHPDDDKQLVFGAADDTKIRSWNSRTGKEALVFSGHFSKVTALQFTPDGAHMVSGGRDRVLILWSLADGRALRTVPVYESVEDLVLLPPAFAIPKFKKKPETEGVFVAAAGEGGVVRVWDVAAARLMFAQGGAGVAGAGAGPAGEAAGAVGAARAVTRLLYNDARRLLAVVTADHNVIIHDLETFDCVKQIVGYTDEVLDVIFIGADENNIVVATNSPDLKYYNLDNMNCEILKGHTDIVLALAKFPTKPDMFVSSGKDNSVRLWLRNDNNKILCLAAGARHTASVGSVFTSQTSADFFASVSQDNCLKLWTVAKDYDSVDQKIKSSNTVLAHQMDINCVTVSPNDKMIATGSQDKTAKLWSADLSLLGVLKGHRRGVWSVRFSPVDQVAVTSSADALLKLWSLADLNCLKTFEGHESSVLKVEFLSKGQQLVSSGADGLVKLWNVKTSECRLSLDQHDGKVWALAAGRGDALLLTGGSDSKLVQWRDVTAERRQQAAKDRELAVLQEQELMNLLHDKKLLKALKMAIRLDRPLHVLNIINQIVLAGDDRLADTLDGVSDTQKETLLKFAAEWNTNNRSCQAAQLVLHALAPRLLAGELRAPPALLEAALPYSERHFDRLTNLLQDMSFITYTVNCMTPHAVKD